MKIFNRCVVVIGILLQYTALADNLVKPIFKNDAEKISYIIGHQIADSLENDKIKIDKLMLLSALKQGLNGEKSIISPQESHLFLQKYLQNQQKINSEQNLKNGKEFLEKNKKEPDVITLASGLQYKIISNGSGEKPKSNDTVTVDYEGKLIDGKVFDSSYQRRKAASFPVSGVIKGWTDALQLMPVGSIWMLYIPADLAYGAQAPSALIGPNSTLIFKVHLISIDNKKNTPKK